MALRATQKLMKMQVRSSHFSGSLGFWDTEEQELKNPTKVRTTNRQELKNPTKVGTTNRQELKNPTKVGTTNRFS